MKTKYLELKLKPGKYVVAVSGGVDSVVLLDLLSNMKGSELIVAHLDHGIRIDSKQDAKLVANLARQYSLPYELGKAKLGPNASENQARQARYKFLESVQKKYKTDGIITAHHQDDVVETALINVLRGSGRSGLTAILDNTNILRPLSRISKKEIIEYAKTHKLKWHEDITNQDPRYLRNQIRQALERRVTPAQKNELIEVIEKTEVSNKETNELLSTLSSSVKKTNKIDRQKFTNLPNEVANELVRYWLKQLKVLDVDKKTVERISLAIKTSSAGTSQPVKRDLRLDISAKFVQFSNTL